MTFQSKSIILVSAVLVTSGLGAGCDHRSRLSAGDDMPRTIRAVDESRAVDSLSRGPSIVRESVDARCFGSSQEANTEVIACPREMQLAMTAE